MIERTFSDPFNEIEEQLFNVIRIDISNDCELPVDCFAHPCSTNNCFSHPTAENIPNYCGGCWSDYYLDGELIEGEVPE